MPTPKPTVFCGPSVYSPHPVLRYDLAFVSSATLPHALSRTLLDNLFTSLPGLRENQNSCDVRAVVERRDRKVEPAAVRHLFEHMCIELARLAGANLDCVRADGGGLIAAHDALVPYEDEGVATAAGTLALEVIQALMEGGPVDIRGGVEAFRRLADREALPAQDRAIIAAARERDIPVIRIGPRMVQLGYGRYQHRLSGTQTTRLNGISSILAANKAYTRQLLGDVGLPVVTYERVRRRQEAVDAARRIGFPVVVKPNNSNMGRGVSVRMKTPREVREAFLRAREYDRSVLVEPFVEGSDFRMLVIDGKLRAASQRIPAHVVGDGVHTIEDLVAEANNDPRRGAGQRSSWTRLEFDDQSDRLLAELGYDRRSVARQGQRVFLRRNANTSSGGTAVDVTDQVHPDNVEIAERAARCIGLDVAGVDLLVPDISKPLREQRGVICEINSRPGIRKHIWPAEGTPRDVTGPIIEMLFPIGKPSRIPIAVVTGTGETLETARLLAHILSVDGSTVGLAASDGVFIRGRRVDGGGHNGPAAARILMLDPAVDVAVLELPPAGVAKDGLGYDSCDACAVVGEEDGDSPEIADAIRVIVEATRRTVVLAADDERCRALESSADVRLWRVDERGQETASPSVMFATTLAMGLGRTPEHIEQGLRTFQAES